MKKLLKFIITSMSFVFILMSIIQSSSTVKVEENNSSIPMNNPVDVTKDARAADEAIASITITSGDYTQIKSEYNIYNRTYEFTDFPYTSTSYTFHVDFTDSTQITNLTLSHNNISVADVPNTYDDFSLDLMFDKEDDDALHIEITTTKTYRYDIKITREIPDDNAYLGTVSIIARRQEEEVTICNSFTSTSLKFVYPDGATALPCTFDSIEVEATPQSEKATLEVKINNLNTHTYTFPEKTVESLSVGISIIVTAEDGTKKTYKGTVVRAQADDNRNITIEEESFTYLDSQGNEQTGTFTLELIEGTDEDGTTKIINYSNPNSLMKFSTIKASFKIVPESPTTKVYIDGIDYTNQTFETVIENTISNLPKRLNLSIKSEKDEILRPNYPTAGGFNTSIDLTSEKPETTRTIKDVNLKHSIENALISNSSNTVIQDKNYSYTLKKSIVGESFKIDLTWNGEYTKAYLATTNSRDIMVEGNLYNPDQVWSIGTDIYIYLQAQSEEYEVYSISTEFEDERSTENGIANVEFKNGDTPLSFTFDEANFIYPETGSLELPYSVLQLEVEITLKHAAETLFIGENYLSGALDDDLKVILTVSLKEGENTFYIQGISEKGENGQVYSFSITRLSGSTENDLESLRINGIDCTDATLLGTNFDQAFSKENSKFSFYASRGTNEFIFELGTSLNSVYTISTSASRASSYIVADGTYQEFNICVKSEVENITGTGAGKNYTIRIYVADKDNKLEDLKMFDSFEGTNEVLDTKGNALVFHKDNSNVPTFKLPFKTKKGYFLPIKENFHGTVAFDREELPSLSNRYLKEFNALRNTFDIIVNSELGVLADGDPTIHDQTFTYKLIVEREAGSTNAYLQSLSVEIDGDASAFSYQMENQDFNKEILGPYTVEYVSKTASSLTINAQTEDPNATIQEELVREIHLSDTTISQTFTITVLAEDEITTKVYSVELWITRADPDEDNTLRFISANLFTNPATNILTPTFTTANTSYQVNIAAEDDVALIIQKQSEYAKIFVSDGSTIQEVTTENGSYAIPTLPSNTEKNFKIYAVAESGAKGIEYNILVKKAADTDATLKELTVNGTAVEDFIPGMTGQEFEIFIGSLDSITIGAVPTKDTATLENLRDSYALQVGENLIDVVVTAEDGTTKETYTLCIIRDADAKLDGIEAIVVEDEQEVDKLQPQFNADEFTGYQVSLLYSQDSLVLRYVSSYNTASVIAPDLTELTSENKEITINNISVGTATYKVRVKTASGITADYEIQITRAAASTDASLKEFKINGEAVTGFTAGMTGGSFEVFIKDADTVYLEGILTDKNAKITSNPCETPVDVEVGENEFTFITTAEDGITTATYIVKAIKDAPKTLNSLSLTLNGIEQILNFNSTTFSYSISLEYEEDELILDFTRTNESLTTLKVLDAKGNEIENIADVYTLSDIAINSSTYKIRITAQSGEYQDYDLVITRDAGSDVNTIESFKYYANPTDTELTELPINDQETSYTYIVNRNTTEFAPEIALTDDKATMILPNDKALLAGQANTKEILVRSQNGKERTYTFVVYPCDTDFTIEDILVKSEEGDSNLLGIDDSFIDYKNNQLELMVASTIASMKLEVVKPSANSIIYVNDEEFTSDIFSLENGLNTFTIYVLSEYGKANPTDESAKSEVVTLSITRVVDPIFTINTQGKKEGPTSKEENITYGSSKSYSFAEEGYTIQSVKIDGVSQEIKETYEFDNIVEDHTIEVIYEINTYTITISVTAGYGGAYVGDEKIESEISYTFGESITFTFRPDEGYLLKQIVLDGVIAGTHSSLSVGISGNHTIELSFEIIKYKITLEVEGEGQITPNQTELAYGSTLEYRFQPKVGHRIKEVLVDGHTLGKVNSYTLTEVKDNHTIKVIFEQEKYTIYVIASGNGTVDPGEDLEYSFGETALYTFVPNIGYHVASLKIDNVDIVGSTLENIIENGYEFSNINTHHTIVVKFEINTYTIEVIQAQNGTISEALEAYTYGADATFTITPNEACHILHLIIDGVEIDPSTTYTFTSIDRNHTISAVFEGDSTTYKVYHHFQEIGSEEYDEQLIEEVSAKVNDSIQYYAPKMTGFEAQPVAPILVQPDGTSAIHVYYDRLSYTISCVEHDGISATTGFGTYPYGSEIEISVEVKKGYRWSSFISSNESKVPNSTDNPYRFTVPAENIEFSFDLISFHTIDVRPTKNGVMDKEVGIYEFNSGEEFTIHFTPNEGYKLKQLIVDGRAITDYQEDSYTFSNIVSNHSFTVEFEQIMFDLSITIHGTTATFSESHRIPYGSSYVYTITPIDGYDLTNMNVDGMDLGPITEYTFEDVKEDHEISIEIEQILYEIMVTIKGNGTVSPSGKNYVTFGSDRVLTFLPETGYYIKNVSIDKRDMGSIETYTFSRVTNDHLVEVVFEQLMYNINLNTPENGAIEYEGDLYLPYGSNKQLSFIPEEGYRIKDIKINNVSIGTPSTYTFLNIQEDQNVVVEFEQSYFTIEVNSYGHGILNPETTMLVPYGSNKKFEIIPELGYTISRLDVDGKSIEIQSEYTFENIREDHSISVEFEQLIYTITIDVIGSGTINSDSVTEVFYGANKDILFTPDYGQRIKRIELDGEAIENTNRISLTSIQEHHHIVVEFEQIYFSITVSTIGNGMVTPNTSLEIPYGDDETYAFIPEDGYKIKEVIVDGEALEPNSSYTFYNITSNHTVSVEFEKIFHTIQVLCGENGTANLPEINTLEHRSNLMCRFTPNEGYRLKDILVDGDSVGGDSTSYYFGNISTDHTIEAVFEEILFYLTVHFGPEGTVTYPSDEGPITPSDKIAVRVGSSFSLNITPNLNYTAKIMINGEKIDTTDVLEFNDIQMDYFIQIEFVQLIHLEISKEGNGTVPESASYEWKTPVTLVFKPEIGNRVKEILIDGKSVGSVEDYSFPNLVADHTVVVIFEPIQYKINYTMYGRGTVSSEMNLNTVLYGQSCDLSIVADEGWQLSIVFVDGVETKVKDGKITIDKVDQDIQIVVYFSEIPVKAIPMWIFMILGAIIFVLLVLLIAISIWNKKRKLYRY